MMLVISMAAIVVGPTRVVIRPGIWIPTVIAVSAVWIIPVIPWIAVAIPIGWVTESNSDWTDAN